MPKNQAVNSTKYISYRFQR